MTKGFFDCGFLLHQLDDGGLRGISAAHAGADHAGVAAVALCIAGSDLLEQLLADILAGDDCLLYTSPSPRD